MNPLKNLPESKQWELKKVAIKIIVKIKKIMTTKYTSVCLIEFRKDYEEIIKWVTMWHNRGDMFERHSKWVEDIRENVYLFVHKEVLSIEETQNVPFSIKCNKWLFKWELIDSEYFTTFLDQQAEEIDRVILG